MVTAHLSTLRSLLERAVSGTEPGVKFECKHFFSGTAAYANGRIFLTLTTVGLRLWLLRPSLDDETRLRVGINGHLSRILDPALLRAEATPLIPRGRKRAHSICYIITPAPDSSGQAPRGR